MNLSSFFVGLALGISTFALSWATVRHFTGLQHEGDLALMIAIAVGVVVGVGWILLESQLFDSWRRRPHRPNR